MDLKELPGQTFRKERAIEFWVRVATDLNAGIKPVDIAKRYKNPATGRNYTREHIYWIIRQVRAMPVEGY